MPKALLITGPTSVGKTQLAFEIARRQRGEVINGDKFYFYKEFNLGTGVKDSISNTDVEKHLYQTLNPHDKVPDASEYKDLASSAIDLIDKKSHLPIMEVYPFSYAKKISEEKTEIAMFGLLPSQRVNLEDKIRQRIKTLLEEGLVSETEQALEKGYRNTFVMENAASYQPLIKVLDGLISLDAAIDEMVQLCLNREDEASKRFKTINSIKWISHNSKDIEPSIKRILSWL